MTIFQSYITEARVYSPAGRVPGGVSSFPLQPSGSRGIDMAALHVHHVTVKGIRFPRNDELTFRGRADIPGGYGSVESIPMCKVFFLDDEVESDGSHHYTLRMMAFVVSPGPVPLVGYYVWVRTVIFTHLISDIAYPVFSIQQKLQSIPPPILEAESS